MAASDDCIIKRWLFSAELIKNTPSVRDGITSAEEMKLRKLACGFIADVGQNLIYPASIVAINSAKIFLHRFYMKESLKQFPDHKLVAVTCLFLACKTEECLRALKDFIWSWNKLEDGHPFGRYHGEDKQRKAWQLDESTKEFQEIRDNILQLERELLHVLGFDFQVYQAQAYIFRMIQFFDGVKRDKETRSLAITTDGEIRYTELGQQVITAAGAMVNDMTRTCLGIQYEATILGAACTFLALRTQNFLVSSTEKWVKKLGEEWQNDPDPRYSSVKVTKEQIQDICNQLLDFYDDAEPSNQTAPSSARVPSTTTSTVTAPSSVIPEKVELMSDGHFVVQRIIFSVELNHIEHNITINQIEQLQIKLSCLTLM